MIGNVQYRHSADHHGLSIVGQEFPTVLPKYGDSVHCNIPPIIGQAGVQRFFRSGVGSMLGAVALTDVNVHGGVFIENTNAVGDFVVTIEGTRQLNIPISEAAASGLGRSVLTQYSRFAVPPEVADICGHGVGDSFPEAAMELAQLVGSSGLLPPGTEAFSKAAHMAAAHARKAVHPKTSNPAKLLHAAMSVGLAGMGAHQAYTAAKWAAGKIGLTKAATAAEESSGVVGKVIQFAEEAAPVAEEIGEVLAFL
jgi:hypothetical protein